MTVRILTLSELPHLVPTIFASRHAVALVPSGADPGWDAGVAWTVARGVAASGRRVLLIDLGVDGAALDTGATRAVAAGIADAFASSGDLQDVAVEQDVAGLYYVGRGSAKDQRNIWTNPRWERLSRGFASEGALLLLALPPRALANFALRNLALMMLASDRQPPTPALNYARAGGELLGMVAPDPAPRMSQPIRRPLRPKPRPRRGNRAFTGIVGLGVILTAGWFAWLRRPDVALPRAMVHRERPPAPLPAVTPSDTPADSLYYSVQVAAHNTLAQAMTHAAELERAGHLTIVTPTRTGNQGVWYRVMVGALPSARAADSLLQLLWQDGVLERPQGTILRTPDAYRLRASRDDLPGLRARGIPAYIVLSPDRTDLVYVGAFDLAEQASSTDSLLNSAHLSGTLVRRTGSSQ